MLLVQSVLHGAVTQSGGVFTQDGGAVFNEGSADVDFRVETNGDATTPYLLMAVAIEYILLARVGIVNAKLQVESLTSDAAISVHRASADTAGAGLILSSSRAATLGDDTVVQDDDILGFIEFDGADGTDRSTPGAQIKAKVDGTPGGK